MGSFSAPKWFSHILALLTVTLTLIGNSSAWKCHAVCPNSRPRCPPADCPSDTLLQPAFGSQYVCKTIYKGKDFREKVKECEPAEKVMNELLGGDGKCMDFVYEEYRKKRLGIEWRIYNASIPMRLNEEDFIEDTIRQERRKPGYDGAAEMKVCACSTDACNDDDYDMKNLGIVITTTKKSSGMKIGPGDYATVICLGLAALVLVNGFLGRR